MLAAPSIALDLTYVPRDIEVIVPIPLAARLLNCEDYAPGSRQTATVLQLPASTLDHKTAPQKAARTIFRMPAGFL